MVAWSGTRRHGGYISFEIAPSLTLMRADDDALVRSIREPLPTGAGKGEVGGGLDFLIIRLDLSRQLVCAHSGANRES